MILIIIFKFKKKCLLSVESVQVTDINYTAQITI